MAKIKTLTVLSATALAVAAALVVQAPGAKAVGKTSCEFNFVTGSPYVEHNAVIGGGTAQCTSTIERFHVSLTIQELENSNWVVRGAESSDELPNRWYHLASWAPCERGAWRVVATLEVRENGKYIQDEYQTNSTIIPRC
ncbi:hypothetical protein AB0M12_19115 [Nocardia vinacea]|uniref:hypothetical protein n=1 Tax=Nocardia vinacea TaxID=96468 RepID=UPI00342B7BB5